MYTAKMRMEGEGGRGGADFRASPEVCVVSTLLLIVAYSPSILVCTRGGSAEREFIACVTREE